ncbi:hypothetical protein [Streptomyces sp. NRRL B-24720]|uniref:hypothetical protein n=1 Tax=Streptomyces sp. NRRL B-24720 TaxID=1476876 RepID=UPI0004C533CD|nr:hypothetical protein [Streptomyces sp. NRRL B-24720]
MAARKLTGAPAATITAPGRTPNWHYAAMRRAESAARSISVRRSAGLMSADELAEAKAVQASYYRLAAAHRSAAHRLERPQRIRARIGRILWPATQIVRSVRRAVTS